MREVLPGFFPLPALRLLGCGIGDPLRADIGVLVHPTRAAREASPSRPPTADPESDWSEEVFVGSESKSISDSVDTEADPHTSTSAGFFLPSARRIGRYLSICRDAYFHVPQTCRLPDDWLLVANSRERLHLRLAHQFTWEPSWILIGSALGVSSPRTWVPLPLEVARLLALWKSLVFLPRGMPFRVTLPSVSISTDASLQGWGGLCEGQWTAGDWSQLTSPPHIYVLEMLAVQSSLDLFQDRLLGRSVLFLTDNVSVAAYINRQGGTHSRSLNRLTAQLWR